MAKRIKKPSEYGAKVYAFGPINGDFVANLTAQLEMCQSMGVKDVACLWHSPGGSVDHGTAAFNVLKQSAVPVDVFIVGVAASMGAYAPMGGRKVYITKFGRMMLHEGRISEG